MKLLREFAFRSLWAACGARGLSILIYHRVLPEPDSMRPGEITVREFEWQMGILQDHFNVLSLRDAMENLGHGSLPSRSVCITFDDGYADNLTVALPVLERHGFAATVFVSSGFLSGGQMWNDSIIEALREVQPGPLDLRSFGLSHYDVEDGPARLAAASGIIREGKYLPPTRRTELVQYLMKAANTQSKGLMLTREDLRELRRRGVEIGGHTVSHPILASLDEEGARLEIEQGKTELEDILGGPVSFFAYPNGRKGQDYRHSDVDLVRSAGFSAAVTTNWGVTSAGTSRLELPRFTPWDRSRAKYLLRMALNARRTCE